MKTIDTSNLGDTKYRLVETENGSLRIELWSSLSKQWRNIYRVKNKMEKWNELKAFNLKISKSLSERDNKH